MVVLIGMLVLVEVLVAGALMQTEKKQVEVLF